MNSKFRTTALAVSVAVASLGGSAAHGAGFALIEQSASGMGNSFAGAAATAEDASTIFYNPAGLSKLKGSQFALAGHYIVPNIQFSNNGSSTSPTAIGSLGGDGGDAGSGAFVPNAYFSMQVNERWTVGVGINAPFGFKTEYDSNWVGRFQGVKSDIETYNINPSVALKVNDTLSLGAGLNYQKLKAELTNKVSGAAINVAFAGQEFDSSLDADDTAWGYNLGLLVQPSDNVNIGVSYRSKMKYTLEGTVSITAPAGASGAAIGAAAAASFPASADVTLPDSVSVSIAYSVTERTTLLADVTYTHWSEIQNLTVINSNTGATRDTLVLNFNDTYRYSLGVNHKCTDRFVAKAGVALDQSPVDDSSRTVRLPDNDRTWLSLGGKWTLSGAAALDFGYAHLFIKDAPIDQTRGIPAAYGRVAGDYTGKIDILSIQYTQSF